MSIDVDIPDFTGENAAPACVYVAASACVPRAWSSELGPQRRRDIGAALDRLRRHTEISPLHHLAVQPGGADDPFDERLMAALLGLPQPADWRGAAAHAHGVAEHGQAGWLMRPVVIEAGLNSVAMTELIADQALDPATEQAVALLNDWLAPEPWRLQARSRAYWLLIPRSPAAVRPSWPSASPRLRPGQAIDGLAAARDWRRLATLIEMAWFDAKACGRAAPEAHFTSLWLSAPVLDRAASNRVAMAGLTMISDAPEAIGLANLTGIARHALGWLNDEARLPTADKVIVYDDSLIEARRTEQIDLWSEQWLTMSRRVERVLASRADAQVILCGANGATRFGPRRALHWLARLLHKRAASDGADLALLTEST